MKPKFIDLFCGIGGFRIAFESEGCECVFSSDIDKYACQSYEANFGDYPTGDITKVDAKDIPDFDILCGGFPCQSFSIAGSRKGFEDTRGTLFFDVARIIRDKQPAMFLLENVKGLVSHDGGKTLDIILSTLAKTINGEKLMFKPADCLNYHVFVKVLNTKDFGLPQNRERIFIVGFKESVNFSFPRKKQLKLRLKDLLESDVDEKYHREPRIMVKINDNKEGFFIYDDGASEGYIAINDNYSPALKASRSNYYLHTLQRQVTPRECFRLQGFPDTYKFVVSDSQLYKQAGNSVSIPVIQAIAKQMLKCTIRSNA